MRALIVDDSRAMRIFLKRALAACGFDAFVEAGDGREALTALEESGDDLPNFAFVDWNMPVMSGLEFVQAARANTAYNALPIVLVTSETAFEHIEAALAAGADEYVMKPFTPEILAEKLALVRATRI
jgi:two-component system, chemotaxis family, chemotaxis protein CheY